MTTQEYLRKYDNPPLTTRKVLEQSRQYKLAKASQSEQNIAELSARVEAGEQALSVAKRELAAAEAAKAGQEARIAIAVNDVIPRFERLFSTPEIKQNPKLLLGDWRHPDFTSEEIKAAREAYMGRTAKAKWPTLAARWFVALNMAYDIETVRRYHNRHLSATA
jgi:hypothetical protein